jgi:hypothetical protein
MSRFDHEDLKSRDYSSQDEQVLRRIDLSDAELMKKVASHPDAGVILNPPQIQDEPAPELRRSLKQMLDDNELAVGRLHSEAEALTIQRVAIASRLEAIQTERAARVQMRNGLQAMIRNFGEDAKP